MCARQLGAGGSPLCLTFLPAPTTVLPSLDVAAHIQTVTTTAPHLEHPPGATTVTATTTPQLGRCCPWPGDLHTVHSVTHIWCILQMQPLPARALLWPNLCPGGGTASPHPLLTRVHYCHPSRSSARAFVTSNKGWGLAVPLGAGGPPCVSACTHYSPAWTLLPMAW